MKNLTLVPVDMSKSNGHSHPDIDLSKTYLCLIGETLYCGKFSKQWYGLSFYPYMGHSTIQFDAPGTNCSDWKEIWEINLGLHQTNS